MSWPVESSTSLANRSQRRSSKCSTGTSIRRTWFDIQRPGIPRVTLSTGVDGRFEFDSMYRGWFTIGVTYKGELLKFGPFSAGTEDAELKVDEPQESEE